MADTVTVMVTDTDMVTDMNTMCGKGEFCSFCPSEHCLFVSCHELTVPLPILVSRMTFSDVTSGEMCFTIENLFFCSELSSCQDPALDLYNFISWEIHLSDMESHL